MTFENFKTATMIAALRSGHRGKISFSEEGGKFIAKSSDGIIFASNRTSSRVEIRWGSGHRAFASAGQLLGEAV